MSERAIAVTRQLAVDAMYRAVFIAKTPWEKRQATREYKNYRAALEYAATHEQMMHYAVD